MMIVCEKPQAETALGAAFKCLHCGSTSNPQSRGLCQTCHRDLEIREQYPIIRHPSPAVTEKCQHCKIRKTSRPRNLCWACFNDLQIRSQYKPLECRYTQQGNGVKGAGNMPAEPTQHKPGTLRKLRVLAERASRGEALFHPDDAPAESRPKPKGDIVNERSFIISESLCEIDT